MNGYVAWGRIEHRSARLGHPWLEPRPLPADHEAGIPAADSAWLETAVDHREPGSVRIRWCAVRERWSQLTFYLFDPNAWR